LTKLQLCEADGSQIKVKTIVKKDGAIKE